MQHKLLATLKAAFLVAILASGSAAGERTYPIGKTGDWERLEILVHDRAFLAVPGAEVVFYGVLNTGLGVSAGGVKKMQITAKTTDSAGRAFLGPLDVESAGLGWLWDRGAYFVADINHDGFAPRTLGPMFLGYSYRTRLGLGRTVYVALRGTEGEVVGGYVRAEFLDVEAPEAQWRSLPSAFNSDSLGHVLLRGIPQGEVRVMAVSRDGGLLGVKRWSVGSDMGHETTWHQPLVIAMRPPGSLKLRTEWDVGSGQVRKQRIARASVSLGGWGRWNYLDMEASDDDRSNALVANLPRNGGTITVELASDDGAWSLVQVQEDEVGRETEWERMIAWSDVPNRFVDLSELLVEDQGQHMLIPQPPPLVWRIIDRENQDSVAAIPVTKDQKVVALLQTQSNGWQEVRLCDGDKIELVTMGQVRGSLRVDGNPAVSAVIRLVYFEGDAVVKEYPRGFRSRNVMMYTDPDGQFAVHALRRGVYRVEPHLHHTVFMDSVKEVTVTNETILCEVRVRRGIEVKGRVSDRIRNRNTNGMVITFNCISREILEHDPVARVAETGKFRLTGLIPGETYEATLWSFDPSTEMIGFMTSQRPGSGPEVYGVTTFVAGVGTEIVFEKE